LSREEGTLVAALRAIVGEARAAPVGPELLADATEQRGVAGRADAVASPSETAAVAAVLRWCYEHDVPLTPRGGGTGLAGGARVRTACCSRSTPGRPSSRRSEATSRRTPVGRTPSATG